MLKMVSNHDVTTVCCIYAKFAKGLSKSVLVTLTLKCGKAQSPHSLACKSASGFGFWQLAPS